MVKMRWVDEARRHIGLTEIKGPQHNPGSWRCGRPSSGVASVMMKPRGVPPLLSVPGAGRYSVHPVRGCAFLCLLGRSWKSRWQAA